ncbi:MAG: hypothetical protein GXP27_04165 [Planctomycetes bacterium]|nr:hypothetical protein [Planctomycetota bacterium]
MTDGQSRSNFRLFAGVRLVSSLTLASRVLGLLRDMGMAAVFGNGAVLDAFTVAFRIPNLARRLFGEGALSTALIPVFLRESERGGPDRAWRVASSVVTVVGVLLAGGVILAETILWAATKLIPCGIEARLLMGLAAVMLPYLLLICAAAQLGAVLQALGHFTWPALLPIILNVGWIAAIWCVTPHFTTPEAKVYALATTIVGLGLVQLVAPWPTLRRFGFRYRFDWSSTRESVTEVMRTMFPIVLGLSITQLNTLCDSLIAWGFSA